jgi:hypothetical protein
MCKSLRPVMTQRPCRHRLLKLGGYADGSDEAAITACEGMKLKARVGLRV